MVHISARKQQKMRKARDDHKKHLEWKAFIRQWEIQVQSMQGMFDEISRERRKRFYGGNVALITPGGEGYADNKKEYTKPDVVINLPYSEPKKRMSRDNRDLLIAIAVSGIFAIAGLVVWAVV